jgi:hypothetical protein
MIQGGQAPPSTLQINVLKLAPIFTKSAEVSSAKEGR